MKSNLSLWRIALFAVLATGLGSLPLSRSIGAEMYDEPYRPQFHFTPAMNWMNDPNGMVYYDGEYHLFYQYNPFGDKWGHMSWGHAVSPDLVHWKHLPLALAEEDGVMIFSGSAVVDWKNTSGFGQNGKPPLIAIYTGHYTSKPLQNQHIAYSNDRGRTWTKFPGNPILDLGEKDFRDPKVFWHEPTKRWVMTVSWPLHRKVRFYASPNLKDWTHLSDFGPAGSTAGIWECPDLFPLTVENPSPEQKWVLVVNVGSGAPAGGSGCQYFVGHFDGKGFALDPTFPKPQPEYVPTGTILADFEGNDYAGWRATGNAFGIGPAHGAIGGQQAVDGFRGRGLVNSFLGGDTAEGTLTSPEFEVAGDYLNFLIGGGDQAGKVCLNLLVNGQIAHTATGDNAERLTWKSWSVRDLRGKKARLEIVDHATGGWGHISVDQIFLADAPAHEATTPALWADWGRDFYAAVSWGDLPKAAGRHVWLGWMSNWTYANDVPTSPWRSAMSIPRELSLRRSPEGLRLLQRPARELNRLRKSHHQFRGGTVAVANAWLAQNGIRSESLELVVEFAAAPTGQQGIQLYEGTHQRTIVGVDRDRREVYLDRTQSGEVTFHPKFSERHAAPLSRSDAPMRLHIYVDACSIEVFANDGEQVLTDLVLPAAGSHGLEFFATADGAKISKLDVWSLNSSWH